MLHLPLPEDWRILWENALEIYRRRAGAEISPVEAFELMVAEVIVEWGGYLTDTKPSKPPHRQNLHTCVPRQRAGANASRE